jgi:hypothetical protein
LRGLGEPIEFRGFPSFSKAWLCVSTRSDAAQRWLSGCAFVVLKIFCCKSNAVWSGNFVAQKFSANQKFRLTFTVHLTAKSARHPRLSPADSIAGKCDSFGESFPVFAAESLSKVETQPKGKANPGKR